MALIFILSLSAGGIKANGVHFFPVMVLIAGFLLGRKQGIIAGVIAGLTGVALLIIEKFGIMPPSTVNYNSTSLWIFSAIIIGLFSDISSIVGC